jgi:hypothetical protein
VLCFAVLRFVALRSALRCFVSSCLVLFKCYL